MSSGFERRPWNSYVQHARGGPGRGRRPGPGKAGASAVGWAALVALCVASPVLGQTREGEGEAEVQAFSVDPRFQLTDVGWVDNVFRVDEADHPVGDFTFTATPASQLSIRLPRLRVDGQGTLDFIYFQELANVRSIDAYGNIRVELPMGRVTPYVGGNWTRARFRRNFEIDLPLRRVDASGDAGVDVRLSGKTSGGMLARWSSVDYAGDSVFLDSNLAQYLHGTALSTGFRVRYAITPLTTIGADLERDRTEFVDAPERNSDGFRVISVVEFRPLALISGRAQIGFRERTFRDGAAPPFRGTVTQVDVGYTLLGQTRLGVRAQRDLSYSYRPDQRDYLQTGLELTVDHRFAGAWDLGGSLGRFRLLYGLGETGPRATRVERVLSYSVECGYRFERTRVGFRLTRQGRSSDFSTNRGYEETRVGANLSYDF